MGTYCSVREWELRPGCAAEDLESLAASGMWEMQQWIPGVERILLVRLGGERPRYLFITTFANHEAYMGWRQIEEEGPDYWERYASVLLHWEQLGRLVKEDTGTIAVDKEMTPRDRGQKIQESTTL